MTVIFSVVILVVFSMLIVVFSNRYPNYTIFFIGVIFLSLSIIDTIIPSILWSIYGNEFKPIWLKKIRDSQILYSLLYYNIFYFIMFLLMILFAKGKKVNMLTSFDKHINIIKKRLPIFVIFTSIIFILSLFSEISSYGGFSEWLFNKFTIRFNPSVDTSKNLLEQFYSLPWRLMFNTFMFTGFFLRYKLKSIKLYGIILPIISIIFSITTSYRGSILTVLLGLFYLEYVRIYIHKKSSYTSNFGIGRETIFKVKYYIFGILIISAFIIYGILRNSYVSEVKNYDKLTSHSAIYKVLSQGSSLQGVSTIMRRYGHDLDYMLGKTYIDMLLLPVPRSIYVSKPKWYGIDEITRNMGWPKSTQSAVSMPGEAYANFGWFGLVIALFYGFIFGMIIKFTNRKAGLYIIFYATSVIPILFVTNWMAFTGFMNSLVQSIFVFICLVLLSFKLRLKEKNFI